jgi:hypothetical protein
MGPERVSIWRYVCIACLDIVSLLDGHFALLSIFLFVSIHSSVSVPCVCRWTVETGFLLIAEFYYNRPSANISSERSQHEVEQSK